MARCAPFIITHTPAVKIMEQLVIRPPPDCLSLLNLYTVKAVKISLRISHLKYPQF